MQSQRTVRLEGDANQWSVGITRETIQRILASDDRSRSDMLSLWMFYAYTAKWQNVNQPRATTAYTATGLGWATARVRRIKKKLAAMGLIEDAVRKQNGRVVGWYVRVFHLAAPVFRHPNDFAQGGEPGDKCSRSGISNAQGRETKEAKERRHRSARRATDEKSHIQQAVEYQPEYDHDPRSKEEQLAAIPPPPKGKYPSQRLFDAFMEENAPCTHQCRQNLYRNLCDAKWRQWHESLNRWVPIRDWKRYVMAVEEKIDPKLAQV